MSARQGRGHAVVTAASCGPVCRLRAHPAQRRPGLPPPSRPPMPCTGPAHSAARTPSGLRASSAAPGAPGRALGLCVLPTVDKALEVPLKTTVGPGAAEAGALQLVTSATKTVALQAGGRATPPPRGRPQPAEERAFPTFPSQKALWRQRAEGRERQEQAPGAGRVPSPSTRTTWRC